MDYCSGSVCADGTAIPPGLIYSSVNSSLQKTWVANIKALEHDVFVSSSPSGWSNDDLGVTWLEQVFDRHTKEKARHGRDYQLLILDGLRTPRTSKGLHLTLTVIGFTWSASCGLQQRTLNQMRQSN
jgi:hypothetical protein